MEANNKMNEYTQGQREQQLKLWNKVGIKLLTASSEKENGLQEGIDKRTGQIGTLMKKACRYQRTIFGLNDKARNGKRDGE